jgi:hypothetical protein
MEQLWQHRACYAAAARLTLNARSGGESGRAEEGNDVTATAPQHRQQPDDARAMARSPHCLSAPLQSHCYHDRERFGSIAAHKGIS